MDNKQTEHTYTFHVHGMHCKACEMMIESELKDVPYVTQVDANLNGHKVEISGYFGEMGAEEVAQLLTSFVQKHGYTLSVDRFDKLTTGKQTKLKNWSDFKIAVPMALVFVVLFVTLQKMGIVNLINAEKVTYGTAFVIGIIASLSTCMAVVGGLVLSMSATFASTSQKLRGASKAKPILFFHTGRLVSFFILGGVIGAIGSAFTLNTSATFILSVLIGIVMLILGINLLDTFPWAKKLQPSMPKFIAKHAHGVSKMNHTLTPLLVGIATFFLPCGFTQSMQIYTLTTGSFLAGGLTMFSFALGTLPVLALVSFSSFSIHNSKNAGVFFKSAGLIVIMFALFNLINSLVVVGLLSPVFNF